MNEGGKEIPVLASYKIRHCAGYLNGRISLYIYAEYFCICTFAHIPYVGFIGCSDGMRR